MSEERLLNSLNKLKNLNARLSPPADSTSFYPNIVPFFIKTLNYIYFKLPFSKIKMKSLSPDEKSPLIKKISFAKREFLTPSRELPSSITYLNQSPFSDFGISNPKNTETSSAITPPEKKGKIYMKKKFAESLNKLKVMLENSRPSISHKNLNEFIYYEMAFNETSRVFRELKEKVLNWSWNRIFEFSKFKEKETLLQEKIFKYQKQWMVQKNVFIALKMCFYDRRNGLNQMNLLYNSQKKKIVLYSLNKIRNYSLKKKERWQSVLQNLKRIKNKVIFTVKEQTLDKWSKNVQNSKKTKVQKQKFILAAKILMTFCSTKFFVEKMKIFGRLMCIQPKIKKNCSLFAIIAYKNYLKSVSNAFNVLKTLSIKKYQNNFLSFRNNFFFKIIKKMETSLKRKYFKKIMSSQTKEKSFERLNILISKFHHRGKRETFYKIKKFMSNFKLLKATVPINFDIDKTREKNNLLIDPYYHLLIVLSKLHQRKIYLFKTFFFSEIKNNFLSYKNHRREKNQKNIIGIIKIIFFFKKTKKHFQKQMFKASFHSILETSKRRKLTQFFIKRNEIIGSLLKRIFILNRKISLYKTFSSLKYIKNENDISNILHTKLKYKKNYNEFEETKKNQISDIFAEKLAQIKKKFALFEDKENSFENVQTPKKNTKNNSEINHIKKELNTFFMKDDPIKTKEKWI